ncbi:hypothetical protein [Roseovarius mucosus]|uniref:hypothetical protein n=1 Tax=Roseovarius mucosus TaxID=215743 RepID=UPI0035CE96FA
MPKKPKGITPEKLKKLIARIEALEIVEPENIATKEAIGENKAVFRAAMKKGWTRDQLVELWNEYGDPIKEGTFAGYLRETTAKIKPETKRKSPKKNGATSKKSEPHRKVKKASVETDAVANSDAHQNADRGAEMETRVADKQTKQVEEVVPTHTEADEDAMLDELIAQRDSAKTVGVDDG